MGNDIHVLKWQLKLSNSQTLAFQWVKCQCSLAITLVTNGRELSQDHTSCSYCNTFINNNTLCGRYILAHIYYHQQSINFFASMTYMDLLVLFSILIVSWWQKWVHRQHLVFWLWYIQSSQISICSSHHITIWCNSIESTWTNLSQNMYNYLTCPF